MASRQHDSAGWEERKRLGIAKGNALLLSRGLAVKNWWRPKAFSRLAQDGTRVFVGGGGLKSTTGCVPGSLGSGNWIQNSAGQSVFCSALQRSCGPNV